jgi:hypothetical protein
MLSFMGGIAAPERKAACRKSHFPAELHEQSSITYTQVCPFVTLTVTILGRFIRII